MSKIKMKKKNGSFEVKVGQVADHVSWQEKGGKTRAFPPFDK
jgi:hypothetical protein